MVHTKILHHLSASLVAPRSYYKSEIFYLLLLIFININKLLLISVKKTGNRQTFDLTVKVQQLHHLKKTEEDL